MFDATIARIRAATYLDENTSKEKRYRVHPPATRKLRTQIAKFMNDQVPAELNAFLDVTAGFEGAGITVSLKRVAAGPTGVLAVYDYGNGDCLGLDEEGDRCAVWWIGHDPYGVILVADSLLDYVARFADAAERGEHAHDDRAMIRPQRDLAPTTTAESVVFDFTGALPRTHVDLPSIPAGYDTQRLGRRLICEPPKPDPSHQVDYLVELAFGLIMMERFDDARAALEKALQLDPSSAAARERMQMLEARAR